MLFQQIRKLIVNDGAVGGVIMPEMLTLMHKFWVLKKLTFLHIFFIINHLAPNDNFLSILCCLI